MIKLRAHHLLCLPRYKGGSYNSKINKKIRQVQKKIKENPNTKIKLVTGTDEICKICPHIKNKKCAKKKNLEYWIRLQDKRVLKELKPKKKINPAKDIFSHSVDKIKNKQLKSICKGCEFLKYCLKYGLNKSFVNKLK